MNSQINSNQDVNNNDTFKQAMEVAAIGAVAVGAGFGIHAAGSALKNGSAKLKGVAKNFANGTMKNNSIKLKNATENATGTIKNQIQKMNNATNKKNFTRTGASINPRAKLKTNKNSIGNVQSQNSGAILNMKPKASKNLYNYNLENGTPGGFTNTGSIAIGSQVSDAFINGLQKDRQILQALIQDYKNAQTATEQANIYDRIMSLISSIKSSANKTNNANEKTMANNMINGLLSQIPNRFR